MSCIPFKANHLQLIHKCTTNSNGNNKSPNPCHFNLFLLHSFWQKYNIGKNLTHPKLKLSLIKEKDMQAYLGEHLQAATTKRHEAELTVLRKSATCHAELGGATSFAEVTVLREKEF